MNIEQFKYVPWNVKFKYTQLKVYTESNQYGLVINLIGRQELCKGLIYGLGTNHLVPHAASALRAVIQYDQLLIDLLVDQLVPILLSCQISTTQVNIFKYIFVYVKEKKSTIITYLLDLLQELPKEKIPIFVAIKLLHSTCTEPQNIYNQIRLNFDSVLLAGLKFQDDDIRMAAFQFLCRCEQNYSNVLLVENFLVENAFVESSPFRNELVKTYALFITKLEHHLLKVLRENEDDTTILTLIVEQHYLWISQFILLSLKNNSYQRNKLALMLYDLVMRYFEASTITPEMRKKGLIRKNVQFDQLEKIKLHLISKEKWDFKSTPLQEALIDKLLDENSDISESSSHILLTYFCDSTSINFTNLYSESVQQITEASKFYNLQSVVLRFEVAICSCPTLMANVCSIIDNYIDVIEIYHTKLQQDFGATIVSSNELYACMLIFLRFKSLLTREQIDRILALVTLLIDTLLNIFHTNDEDSSVVPSFADMAAALNKVLNVDEVEETLLTDEEQMLLNRIWLNLKVCSDVITMIGTHALGDTHVHIQCINLLSSILQRNRHKGVIEGAGHAMSNLVKHMTANDVSSQEVSKTLKIILESLGDESSRSSCTRRTAGLSILVSRIVLGDQRSDNPLLREAMDALLSIIRTKFHENISIPEAHKDTPLVVVLHCLRPLVHDASLWLKCEKYLMELLQICFENMSSSEWNIRNAALQLYGALIPKITGQNKDVSTEDIHTKHPSLLQYIKTILEMDNIDCLFQIFQLLSQTFVVSHRDADNINLWTLIENIKILISTQFQNRNYYLRNLAAKSYAVLTSVKYLESTIRNIIQNVLSDLHSNIVMNKLHGEILTIAYLYDRMKLDGVFIFRPSDFEKIQKEIDELLCQLKCVPPFVIYPLILITNNVTSNLFESDIKVGRYELTKLKNRNLLFNDADYFLSSQFESLISSPILMEDCVLSIEKMVSDSEKILPLQLIINKLFRVFLTTNCKNLHTLIENVCANILIENKTIDLPQTEVEINEGQFIADKKLITFLPFKCCLLKYMTADLKELSIDIVIADLKQMYLPLKKENVRFQAANTLLLLLQYVPISTDASYVFDILFICYWLLLDEDLAVRQSASLFVIKLKSFLSDDFYHVQHAYPSVLTLFNDCVVKLLKPQARRKFIVTCLLTCQSGFSQTHRINPFAHKFIANKNEDFYLLNILYTQLTELLEQITSEELSELKQYVLEKMENNDVQEESNVINPLKIEFSIKVQSLFNS